MLIHNLPLNSSRRGERPLRILENYVINRPEIIGIHLEKLTIHSDSQLSHSRYK